MKKEEKRKLSLEQLKRLRKILTIIVVVIWFLGIAIMIIGNIAYEATSKEIFLKLQMYFFITTFCTLGFWMFCVDLFLGEKIQDEEANLKIVEIKNKAKKGNLKGFVLLKNNKIENEILINNIEKLLLKGVKQKILSVDVYLKNGNYLSLQIQEEKILSILSQKSKEEILDNVIDSITIEDLEQKTMQVKINSKGCMVNERADDYNLDAWFELKE